jgi:hypothetical protein
MSISGILSSSYQNQLTGASSTYQQQIQQLGQALTSGNLSAAQSDFASLQAAFSQPASTSGSATGSTSGTTTSPSNQAFNQLASDLQSGNLSAAQKDFTNLQSDLKPLGPGSSNQSRHHHHLGGGGDSNGQNSLLQDLNQVGTGLTSGNLFSAQQSYNTLQQQFQQFALSGTALSSESPFSLQA